MKILYATSSGHPLAAVWEKDWFAFKHEIQVALTTFEIDEVDPDNKSLCADLYVRINGQHKNAANQGKYYFSAGQLFEREGWIHKPFQLG